jgi:GNAT superfamily N-acetyltransferase
MNEDGLFEVLLGLAQNVAGGEGVSHASATNGATYIYRNADEIVGVLCVLSSGVFVIAVRSDSRRQGIATALLNAAAEDSASPKPDFNKTTYSQDGQVLVDAYLIRKATIEVSR